MKLFYIFFALMLFAYAEDYQDIDVAPVEETMPETFSEQEVSNVNNILGFKWAWEMSKYAKSHARLKGKPWVEAANLWELSGSFAHRRENDDQDNYSAIGYASFRPLVYDFGYGSAAFGISTIIRYSRVSDVDPKFVVADLGGGLIVNATASQVKTEAFQNAINFSTLLSFPHVGFQMLIDIGYGFSNLRETIDPIEANVGGNILTLDEYQYHQKDRGFFAGINFLKSFDRPYLDYVRLFVYGAYREVTTKRKSSATIFVNGVQATGSQFDLEQPFAGLNLDPQTIDESNISFIAYQLYVRLFTIHTPISEDRGISVSFFNQMVYTSFELIGENFHGAQWKWGTDIGIFDALSMRFAFVNETGGGSNDKEDAWEVSVSVRLSGLIHALTSN